MDSYKLLKDPNLELKTGKKVVIAREVLTHKFVKDKEKIGLLRETAITSRMSKSYYFPDFVRSYESTNRKGKKELHLETMEASGTKLGKFMESNPATKEMLQSIFYQVGCALDDLHRANIVHRNLNFSNIIVTPDLQIQIVGLDKAKYGPMVKGYSGNKYFAAPETEAHKHKMFPKPYSYESDFYSVGIMAYKIAYGQYPAEIASQVEAMKRRNAGSCLSALKPKTKATKNPVIYFPTGIDEDLRNFIRQLLELKPKYRLSGDIYFQHQFFHGFKQVVKSKKTNMWFRPESPVFLQPEKQQEMLEDCTPKPPLDIPDDENLIPTICVQEITSSSPAEVKLTEISGMGDAATTFLDIRSTNSPEVCAKECALSSPEHGNAEIAHDITNAIEAPDHIRKGPDIEPADSSIAQESDLFTEDRFWRWLLWPYCPPEFFTQNHC